MSVLVVGIANHETGVPIGEFPVQYSPTRYLPGRTTTRIGGVGFNVARTLAQLGSAVRLAAPLGRDVTGDAITVEADCLGIDTTLCTRTLSSSPRSVVLYADDGRRQVITDLGDAVTATFDAAILTSAQPTPDAVVLGNLDFSRPLLAAFKDLGVPLVVDLQDVQGIENPYDRDFFTADVLVMSHERLAQEPRLFLQAMRDRTSAGLIVLTLGAEGSLHITRNDPEPWHTPTRSLQPGVNTAGAGDTFTGALTHFLFAQHLRAKEAVVAAAGAVDRYLALEPVTTGE